MSDDSSSGSKRVRRQRAAMYAFGWDALSANDAELMARSAVTNVVAAVDAAAGSLLGLDEARRRLETLQVTGFPTELDVAVALSAPGGLQAEAVQRRETVARELSEHDFVAAPHLRVAGMRFGASTPLVLGQRRCVLSVFSAGQAFDADDLQTVEAAAALSSKAMDRILLERQLAEREATLRALLHQLPAIVWTTDANLVFTNVLGGAIDDMPLRVANVGVAAEATDMSPAGLAAMKAALRGEPQLYTFSSGELRFDVRVAPIHAEDGSIRGVLAIAFDVTDRIRAEAEARASREELRQMAALMNMREEEQRRMFARDIHDEMGQRLTALRLELGLLARESGAAAQGRIESMSLLIREAADTVRRVAADLRPPMLDDFGFRATLENEADSFTRRTGIATTLSFPKDDPPLDHHLMTALYRIVQESLTNVARHSGARRASVAVRLHEDGVELEIADDGRGITAAEASSPASIGLAGIRERVYALGGEVAIGAEPGSGTTVRAHIPLP